MKETDIAYAAGLIDGEGCIRVKKTTIRKDCTSPSYIPQVQIRMVDEAPIAFIKSLFGGGYNHERAPTKNRRPLYCYVAHSLTAVKLLEAILPYLKVKQYSAQNALGLAELKKSAGKYRTKVTGYRNFPNSHGFPRQVPNLSYTDDFLEMCEMYHRTSRELNKVGLAAM